MFTNFEYKNGGFLIVLEGDVTLEDIKAANKKKFFHPEYQNIKFNIWDYQNVTNVSVLTSEISKINDKAKKHRIKPRPIKVAMVADQPFTYGISRMYSSLSENSYWKFEVFKTMEEAEAWVNS